jgi:hypothetical protein
MGGALTAKANLEKLPVFPAEAGTQWLNPLKSEGTGFALARE